MSGLDEITEEKHRLSEAVALVGAQRERISSQLSELEATERVLARYGQPRHCYRPAQRDQIEPRRPNRKRRVPRSGTEKFADSSREGTGFELPVPRGARAA
jgi:hypothetical protein